MRNAVLRTEERDKKKWYRPYYSFIPRHWQETFQIKVNIPLSWSLESNEIM